MSEENTMDCWVSGSRERYAGVAKLRGVELWGASIRVACSFEEAAHLIGPDVFLELTDGRTASARGLSFTHENGAIVLQVVGLEPFWDSPRLPAESIPVTTLMLEKSLLGRKQRQI